MIMKLKNQRPGPKGAVEPVKKTLDYDVGWTECSSSVNSMLCAQDVFCLIFILLMNICSRDGNISIFICKHHEQDAATNR
jgi:hypothetical protein